MAKKNKKTEPKIVAKLREEIDRLEYELRGEQSEKDRYKGKYEASKEIRDREMNNFENKVRTDNYEINYLRDLVELITVPTDKLNRLDELRKKRERSPYA